MQTLRFTVLSLTLLLATVAGIDNQALAQAISADAAASIAAQATGGRVLGVQLTGPVYTVRVLLPDGVVRDVAIDANTGAVR